MHLKNNLMIALYFIVEEMHEAISRSDDIFYWIEKSIKNSKKIKEIKRSFKKKEKK